jgi:hypothetical protein
LISHLWGQCSALIHNLFEREANNFARFILFQGDSYRTMAADHPFGIKTPMKLAKKFGVSVYASCRESGIPSGRSAYR